MYPAHANLIQQGASNGARRPLTPNGTAEAQQQVQVGVNTFEVIPTTTTTTKSLIVRVFHYDVFFNLYKFEDELRLQLRKERRFHG